MGKILGGRPLCSTIQSYSCTHFPDFTTSDLKPLMQVCDPDDMEDFGREEEEEYDSVGSSTSSDLGGGEEEGSANVGRKRTETTLRCIFYASNDFMQNDSLATQHRPEIRLLSALLSRLTVVEVRYCWLSSRTGTPPTTQGLTASAVTAPSHLQVGQLNFLL